MVLKRKAIIITGYGTSKVHNLQLVYGQIKCYISNIFPDYDIKITFASIAITHILRGSGIYILDITEILTQLRTTNYEEVVLLSTHLLPCNEYE